MMRMKWTIALLLLTALALSACRPIQPPAAPEANKVMMAQLAGAWSDYTQKLVDVSMLKPEFVLHQAEFPGIASARDYQLFIYDVHSFVPDFKATFFDTIAEGDWVAARGLMEATPGGERHVGYGVLHVARVVDGQIAELWTVSDEVAVNKYFGEIPNPDERAEFRWGDDSAVQGVTGTREENMALVRQWLEGGEAAPAALAHDAFMFHSTMYPEQHTLQDRIAIMEELRTAFPDLTITVEEPMIVEGDRVGVRFTMQGTNTGPFLDREASGKSIEWPGIALYRVIDGTIAEEWILWSGYYVYSQIRGW